MSRLRREFLVSTAVAVGATVLGPLARASGARTTRKHESEEEISAPEDLMREHGVLDRILLVYEEGLRRLRANTEVAADVFRQSAELVRNFVEDYHEHLEEQFIFPQFERRHAETELVTVLRQQHAAGRRVTDVVLRASAPDQFASDASRQQLQAACEAFIRMYRPHAAREDTVLFPALYRIAGPGRVKELGEQFEAEEHRRFGAHGFEQAVDQVAALEQRLGIADLAAFTPP
jgi:hemerythrin-like domain-containing protein